MINWLNSWIQGIIIAIIVSIIIEMILPEGKNKKYITTVIGIYMTFVIISPIISIFKKDAIDVNNIVKYSMEAYTNYNIQNTDIIDENKYIEEQYIVNLKSNIKNSILEKGYLLENIDIKIETEKEKEYGTILTMNLKVSKAQKQDNNIKQIEEVKISSNDDKKDDKKLSIEEISSLKEFLAITYSMEQENIIIEGG